MSRLQPSEYLRHANDDRRTILGASEVAAIYGVSPWITEYAVWASKTSPEALPERDDGPQAAGRAFEAAICEIVCSRIGALLTIGDAYTDRPLCVQTDPLHPLGAHPDAWLLDGAGWHPLEVKTISHHRDQWPEDGVVAGLPVHYELQVRAQLACCPAKVRWGYLAAALGFDDVRIYRIERDDALEADMLAEVLRWWDLHVRSMSEPAVDGSDRCASWLLARFPRETADLREATTDEAEALADWRQAKDALSDAEAIEGVAKARVQRAIGEAQGLVSAAGTATWKAQTAKRIDVEGLRSRWPEAAKDCERVSESRVLRWRGTK